MLLIAQTLLLRLIVPWEIGRVLKFFQASVSAGISNWAWIWWFTIGRQHIVATIQEMSLMCTFQNPIYTPFYFLTVFKRTVRMQLLVSFASSPYNVCQEMFFKWAPCSCSLPVMNLCPKAIGPEALSISLEIKSINCESGNSCIIWIGFIKMYKTRNLPAVGRIQAFVDPPWLHGW